MAEATTTRHHKRVIEEEVKHKGIMGGDRADDLL
jgi:hypothetical protein